MMRYFFHRTDGGQDIDHEGIELRGVDEAAKEAVHFASDTLKDENYTMWMGGEFRVDVTDASKDVIFTVVISTVFSSGYETQR